jgi:hypothetical protein
MARYSIKTGLKPIDVVKEAEKFFGLEIGLKVKEKGTDGIIFGKNREQVIILIDTGDKTEVTLETKEFDYQVMEFMRKL